MRELRVCFETRETRRVATVTICDRTRTVSQGVGVSQQHIVINCHLLRDSCHPLSLLRLPGAMPAQSKLSRGLLKECDALARSLGVTPVFDKLGIIIAIGMPEEKGRVYVVWVGRAIGLFYNWCVITCQLHLRFV